MLRIYVYVLNTMADWELGYVMAELNSRRFFKKDAPETVLKTVGFTKEPIKTMGGLTVTPDELVDDIVIDKNTFLLLPGADTWHEATNGLVLKKAGELLSIGAHVAAICGATVALANCGLLDNRKHTSNGVGFLDMFCSNYRGKDLYVDEPSVRDGGLITASSFGGLYFAKQIIETMGVFKEETLKYWYQYFSTGKVDSFYGLMRSLPQKN